MSNVGERCPTKILRSWVMLVLKLLAIEGQALTLGFRFCWRANQPVVALVEWNLGAWVLSQVLLKVRTWFSLEILKHSESHVSGDKKVQGNVKYRDIHWPTLVTVTFLLQQWEACITVAAQHGQATFTVKSTVLFRKALIRNICLKIHLPRHMAKSVRQWHTNGRLSKFMVSKNCCDSHSAIPNSQRSGIKLWINNNHGFHVSKDHFWGNMPQLSWITSRLHRCISAYRSSTEWSWSINPTWLLTTSHLMHPSINCQLRTLPDQDTRIWKLCFDP